MKFLIMGDLHEKADTPRSRTDDFQESKNNKIKEILKIKEEKNISHILQMGDFFDKTKYENSFLIKQFLLWANIEEKLKDSSLKKENFSLIKAYENYPSLIGVLGNHEMPGGNYNEEAHKQTPYYLFEKIGIPLMKFVTKENPIIFETEDGLKIAITGTNYHLDIDKPGYEDDYIVEEKLGDIHIHIVHGFLTEKYKGKMFHHTLVKDIAHKTKADITLTGHDHIGFDLMEVDGKYFLNPGAILRLSNDKKEMNREIKVYSLEITKENGVVFEKIPLKSAKKGTEILDRSKIEKSKAKKKLLEEFKQKVRAGTESNSIDIISFINSFKENEELGFSTEIIDKAIQRVTSKKLENEVVKDVIEPYTIKSIILKNFESHKDTTVHLNEHLNVLIGESGHGKSSVLRAIEWVVENNPAGRSIVRIGESKTSATLVLSNGYEITRYVTKSKNGYMITEPDGTTTEYNTKAIGEVQKKLGYTKVRIDKDMIYNFNISKQGEGWFLIGNQYTAPGRSKIVGSIYGTHHADAANREVKSEILSLRDKNKKLYDRKDIVEKELGKYEHLDTLKGQIEFLELKIKEINAMKKEKETLLMHLKQYHYKKNELIEVEKTLKALPSIENLKLMYFELKEQFHKKEQLVKLINDFNSTHKKMTNIQLAITQTENLDQYRNLVNRMKTAEETKSKIIKFNEEMKTKKELLNKELLVIKETENLDVAKEQLVELKKQFEVKEKLITLIPQYEKNNRALQNILLSIQSTSQLDSAKEQLKKYLEMMDEQTKLKELQQKHSKFKVLIKKEDDEIQKQQLVLDESIEQYNEELKISKACPTCFAPITEETTQRILTKFKGGNK